LLHPHPVTRLSDSWPVPDEPTPQPAPPAPSPSPAPQPDPTPDPKDVARQIAAAVKQAKAEAKAEVDAFLAEQSDAAARAQMDEIDRVKAEKADADAKLKAAKQELAEREHTINVRDRLLEAEVPVRAAPDVAKLVDVEVGADEATIDAAISALRDRLPQLFTPGAAPQPREVPTQQNQPVTRAPANTIDPARERARQRHGFKPPVNAA
jgi:uncharacterized protein YdaU (DUF1376 family)